MKSRERSGFADRTVTDDRVTSDFQIPLAN